MTDIHIRVAQETGELMAFDDDDNEITSSASSAVVLTNRRN